MTNGLKSLRSVDELEAAVAASFIRPVLIFKHSVTCGTSALAREEIDDLLGEQLPVDVYLAYVQDSRAVTLAITERFGIRHESPQALLIVAGRVTWHASHFQVSARSILEALRSIAPSTGSIQTPLTGTSSS